MARRRGKHRSDADYYIGTMVYAANLMRMFQPTATPTEMFRQPMRGYPVVNMDRMYSQSDLLGVVIIRHTMREVLSLVREIAKGAV